ncbi:hypothetical protein [Escherichia coli]
MSEQKITGIELAKTNFYLFSINAHGTPQERPNFLAINCLTGWCNSLK